MSHIIVNAMAEEMRMAVVDEQNQLIDFVLEREQAPHSTNHIYKGIVRNVLPGMQAAFVDIGTGQNAYLNLGSYKQTQILKKVHVGQSIMVQVVKEAMLGKSARVTADISLAGRFNVLLPFSQSVHLSKKVTDEGERQRLLAIGNQYLKRGAGSIMRTAASRASDEQVEADLEYLWQTWEHIQKRYTMSKPGTDLYSDADFWFRLVRDFSSHSVQTITVDDNEGAKRLRDLLARGASTQHIQVILHEGPEPIFKARHIEPQIEALINADVELPSGGSIRIDHTEALTVMDVNSAHYTGKSNQIEDLALQVNKEAAVEICRQLRLRDIGGIIICDFIDMKKKDHQQELLDLLAQLARQDRMKTVVCGISKLGLVEMTRKRARQGLRSLVFDTCSQCGGTGVVLSAYSVYLQIVRRCYELYRGRRLKSDLEVIVNPSVARMFTKERIQTLEDRIHKSIIVTADSSMSLEGFSLLSISNE